MKTAMDVVRDLAPLGRAVCSRDSDRTADYLKELLPFRIISVDDSKGHNGWVIPPSWDVEEAKISKDGRLVYDGGAHPLGVIALSAPFSGRVNLEELKSHLHYDHRNDAWIPYHYRQQFRSWRRDWGFCLPKKSYDDLRPGVYDVVIRTTERPGSLKILEYRHEGASDLTIVLGANIDHAGLANDGISGCAVGLEVMRRLRGRKTKFSYSLVLSPGIVGSEYYLALLTQVERRRILEGIFLEMLGSSTQLAVQDSRQNLVSVAHALKASLTAQGLRFRSGPFESVMVNDEYIWENYGIPMLSLSRFPYPEYHSSADSIEIIEERFLTEAVDALAGMIDRLESSPVLTKRFEGNVCLSNPMFDLYVDYGQIALGEASSEDGLRMRRLMDLIPALNRPVSVRAVADQIGLSESVVYEYLKRWASKGLIEFL